MTAKDWLKVVAVFATFFLVAPYLLKLRFWLFNKPCIEVLYATTVSGRVTGSYVNRQYHLHYLNGETKTQYDFNAFLPATPVPAGLSQEDINRLGLGPYLEKGDYITKAAHSTTLSVQRGDSTTQWVCSPDSSAFE